MVSILVFVELALDAHNGPGRCHLIYRVSILVFVELALDAHHWLVGDLSPTIVSILVFVELALDELPAFRFPPAHPVFQSLFSWNLLLMLVRQ